MIVWRQLEDLSGLAAPAHLAIGVFDGLHLGHQAVIRNSTEAADASGGVAVLVTFDPHPVTVLRPEMSPRLLTHTRHKLLLAERMGVTHALVIAFDEAFSKLSGREFLERLNGIVPDLRQICVGSDWRFGQGRSGDLGLLQDVGNQLGFRVDGAETVTVEGQCVSSTAIREAIQEGNLVWASKLLGRDYTVLGTVVEGQKLGRQIGVPTANLSVYNEQLPPSGVYVMSVNFRGRTVQGIGNLGHRPTVASADVQRRLEIHLLDFKPEEFYGEELEASFRHFLRPERKFAGLEELTAQIQRDIAQAREWIAKAG